MPQAQSDKEESAFAAAVEAASESEAEETAEETTEEPEQGEAEAEEAEAEEPEAPAADADPVAAAKEAFDKGDIEALAKALGTKAPELDNKAFVRMRKAEGKLAEAKREGERQAQLLAEARRMYGPLAKARVAAKKGDVSALKSLIEGIVQGPIADILPKLTKAASTPSEIDDLRREVAELRKASGRSAKYGELDGHAVSKLPDWVSAVEEAVEASYDDELEDYTLTPREAADALVAQAKTRAAALLGSGSKKKPVPGKRVVKEAESKPLTAKDKEERDFRAALLAATVAPARGRRHGA